MGIFLLVPGRTDATVAAMAIDATEGDLQIEHLRRLNEAGAWGGKPDEAVIEDRVAALRALHTEMSRDTGPSTAIARMSASLRS